MASDCWLYRLLFSAAASSDCVDASSLFIPFSSASSVISMSLRWRRELVEEGMDPEAACSKQAEDNALSVNSDAAARAKTVS